MLNIKKLITLTVSATFSVMVQANQCPEPKDIKVNCQKELCNYSYANTESGKWTGKGTTEYGTAAAFDSATIQENKINDTSTFTVDCAYTTNKAEVVKEFEKIVEIKNRAKDAFNTGELADSSARALAILKEIDPFIESNKNIIPMDSLIKSKNKAETAIKGNSGKSQSIKAIDAINLKFNLPQKIQLVLQRDIYKEVVPKIPESWETEAYTSGKKYTCIQKNSSDCQFLDK